MDRDSLLLLTTLVSKLRRRQVKGSFATAQATVACLRSIVSKAQVLCCVSCVGICAASLADFAPQWQTMGELIELLRDAGKQLVRVNQTEYTIGNMVSGAVHTARVGVAIFGPPTAAPATLGALTQERLF